MLQCRSQWGGGSSVKDFRVTSAISLYLDAIRVIAALAVLFGHLSGLRLTGGLFWQAAVLMEQAVTVFFVLSGFVIAYVTDTRRPTALTYAIERAARIYSVALPAILVTLVLDTIGRTIRPASYGPEWGYIADHRLFQVLSGLVFANELPFTRTPVLSDLPYWSLGYEVWYYVIFAVWIYSRPTWRLASVAVILAGVGWAVAAMFPMWLLGVALWRFTARRTVRPLVGALLWVASSAAWAAFNQLAAGRGWLDTAIGQWLGHPTIVEDYLVAILFGLNVFGFIGISCYTAPFLNRFASLIRWASGASFSIYLMHLPLAVFLSSLVIWPPNSWQTRVIIFGGTLVGVFCFAEFTERRKNDWRRALRWLIGRFIRQIT